MNLVVYGLRNSGLTDMIAVGLDATTHQGMWGATLGIGLLTDMLSSIMNKHADGVGRRSPSALAKRRGQSGRP